MEKKPAILFPGIMILVCLMLLVFNQLYLQRLFMRAIEIFLKVSADENLVAASDMFFNKMYISFYLCMGIISFLLIIVLTVFRRLMVNAGHEITKSDTKQKSNRTLLLEEANQNIMDSIKYAKLIQSSLLPDKEIINEFLPHNFIIWQPRDVVSGDIFYFYPIVKNLIAHEDGLLSIEDGMIIAVVDCTGHGVPGAFMTMIASSGIRRIIRDEGCVDPAEILTRLNIIVKTTLYQESSHSDSDDGMDVGICFIKPQDNQLIYAGARIPLIVVKEKNIQHLKGDRCSIGYRKSDPHFVFQNHTIQLEKNMCFYLYTDGIVDQTGGEKGFPFGTRRLKELLIKYSDIPMNEQKQMIITDIDCYRGKRARVDDLTMVGFKVKNIR
ncbi:stage II sporulation protein E [Candidatus Magnetomorum sp. HK-1]|nr:stage II sporulation protein E [Candidatus Magnetomorum sp. HK-1]